MKLANILCFSMLFTSLAACSGVRELERTRIEGTEFGHYLARGYRDLAFTESERMRDARAAEYFAQKALKSQANLFVEPSLIEQYDIPQESMAEVAHARSELITALLAMKTPENFRPLANAQVKFDCWLENIDDKDAGSGERAASCRDEFLGSMDEVVGNLTLSKAFMVFFPLNSVAINEEAMQTLKVVADILKVNQGIKISLTGNTDTTGPEAYNDTLSMRRAQAVQRKLHDLGVSGAQIELLAGGEHNLLVITPDNTKELKNRRVDILITKL